MNVLRSGSPRDINVPRAGSPRDIKVPRAGSPCSEYRVSQLLKENLQFEEVLEILTFI